MRGSPASGSAFEGVSGSMQYSVLMSWASNNRWPHHKLILLFALTLQIQSGKCCALGEFLIKLWSAMQVQYACTARVVLIIHIDHNLIIFTPSCTLKNSNCCLSKLFGYYNCMTVLPMLIQRMQWTSGCRISVKLVQFTQVECKFNQS